MPKGFPQSHLINISKDTFTIPITGNSKGFRSSAWNWVEHQIYICYCKSQHYNKPCACDSLLTSMKQEDVSRSSVHSLPYCLCLINRSGINKFSGPYPPQFIFQFCRVFHSVCIFPLLPAGNTVLMLQHETHQPGIPPSSG